MWCHAVGVLLVVQHPRRAASSTAAFGFGVGDGGEAWFESVIEVDLTACVYVDVSGVLAELEGMPSLRSLVLPASCAKSAVDAEALCGLTTLTTLRFEAPEEEYDEDDELVEEVGEWVLDFRRLPTLTSLDVEECAAVTDKQVQELSNLTGLTALNLLGCWDLTSVALQAVSSINALTTLKLSLPASCAEDAEDAEAVCGLTALTALRFHAKYEDGEPVEGVGVWKLDLSRLTSRLTSLNLEECAGVTGKEVLALSKVTGLVDLNLCGCRNVTSEGLRAVSSLTALVTLNLSQCINVTSEGLRAVSRLTALTTLRLSWCNNVSDEGLQTLSSLNALSTLYLWGCPHVTAAAKQALRTAIPNLTIMDGRFWMDGIWMDD
jgi:hypothetical protein